MGKRSLDLVEELPNACADHSNGTIGVCAVRMEPVALGGSRMTSQTLIR
jgi:hypothetical protein